MLSLFALLAALVASPTRAWDQHARLTAAALQNIAGLDAVVKVETLSDYLAAQRLGTVDSFLRARKANPTTTFPFGAGETAGRTFSLRAVVSYYSDEPDWGLDQDLFDFYPELWKDDYMVMGGRTGFSTRTFRHCYWPLGYLKPAPPPAKLPVKVNAPIGEAPQRAQLFLDESRRAFASGHLYWGGRFLAWSLHYIEDLTQPFHAVQLPVGDFVQFRPDGTIDVDRTARTVAFYHLVMDGYPAQSAQGKLGPAAKAQIAAAMTAQTATPVGSAKGIAVSAARFAAAQAAATGRAMRDLFPEPTPADLADPLAASYNPAYWSKVLWNLATQPQDAVSYQALVVKCLAPAGAVVRALAAQALSAIPMPAAPKLPRAAPIGRWLRQHAAALAAGR